MRKALTIVAGALLCISAWGQTSARDIISILRGSGSVSCNYSYTAKGDFPVSGQGSALISGKMYHLTGTDTEIWCDGVSIWTVDKAGKEVVISDGSASPLSRLEDYAEIIHIRSYSGGSLRCSIKNETQGLDIDFSADGITTGPATEDAGLFSFDTSSLGKDWIITDLR